ncbi:MAG: glycosyltransferase family 4 protein [Cyclobacteriaceae bacterium]|nr:glycosyltransferase family 4 protein [Cyclobacteriaceae bacterium]
MKRLALITTHPIQYNAPFYKLLTERGKVRLKVFYTWPQAIEGFDDPDFGTKVKWDIPLLEGYDWEAVNNVSKKPSSKKWGGIDCPNLIDKINAYQPDAVMVYGWNLKSHFHVMRHFKNHTPVWFFGDSTLLDEKPGWRKWIRRLWLTWVYRHIDRAFYVGSNNKAYFIAHGLKEEQLVFFPHAVDNERFFDNEERQYEKRAQQMRKELGFQENDNVILFAGKLEVKKDPLLLLAAVQQVNTTTDRSVKLLFVGNGPLESELRARTVNNPYVKFLPFQNQSIMPVVYRLGNVFCLPSRGPGETWGLAVNEAMACGRPVIVSNQVGCAVDLIMDNINGKIVYAGDRNSVISAIAEIEPVSLSQMGRQSAIHVIKWNYAKKAEAVENAIHDR